MGGQGLQTEDSSPEDARAGAAPECYQTARLDSEKHMVPLRFGCGVCFCFDRVSFYILL